MIAIVHVLVALVRHYRAPIRLPENVFAKVVIVKVRWRNTLGGGGGDTDFRDVRARRVVVGVL